MGDMTNPTPKYATIPEWCRLTGLSRTASYEALSRGDLNAVKLGARTLVNVEAGLAWLATLPRAEFRGTEQRTAA
jgi:predicted DNA-binding transcriptional regulator AlpA